MHEALSASPEVAIPDIEEAAADQQLAHDRFDIPALVAKADHRFLAGEHRAAAAFYSFAAKCAAARGVRDKPTSETARRAQQMTDWLAQRFRDHILSGLDAAGLPADSWPERFRVAVEIMFGERQREPVYERFPQMPKMFFYPGLPYVDFVEPSAFSWRSELEGRFEDMREEAAALLADTADFSPYVTRTPDRPQGDVHGLLENPDWSSLYLWTNGAPVEENVRRCPRIFEAVMQHAPLCRIGRRAPAVLLSLLKPGAHIPPHSGMLNIRYICHIPLIVPPDCWLRVGERTAQWSEGRLLTFDDSVEHEARNGSGEDRLVLIFDVWNPHLSEQEKVHVRTMLEIVDDYR